MINSTEWTNRAVEAVKATLRIAGDDYAARLTSPGYRIDCHNGEIIGSLAIYSEVTPFIFYLSYDFPEKRYKEMRKKLPVGVKDQVHLMRITKELAYDECVLFDFASDNYSLRSSYPHPERDDIYFLSSWKSDGSLQYLSARSIEGRPYGHWVTYEENPLDRKYQPWEGIDASSEWSQGLGFPQNLYGTHSIVDIPVPWNLPDIDSKVEKLLASFDFSELISKIKISEVSIIPEKEWNPFAK